MTKEKKKERAIPLECSVLYHELHAQHVNFVTAKNLAIVIILSSY